MKALIGCGLLVVLALWGCRPGDFNQTTKGVETAQSTGVARIDYKLGPVDPGRDRDFKMRVLNPDGESQTLTTQQSFTSQRGSTGGFTATVPADRD